MICAPAFCKLQHETAVDEQALLIGRGSADRYKESITNRLRDLGPMRTRKKWQIFRRQQTGSLCGHPANACARSFHCRRLRANWFAKNISKK